MHTAVAPTYVFLGSLESSLLMQVEIAAPPEGWVAVAVRSSSRENTLHDGANPLELQHHNYVRYVCVLPLGRTCLDAM